MLKVHTNGGDESDVKWGEEGAYIILYLIFDTLPNDVPIYEMLPLIGSFWHVAMVPTPLMSMDDVEGTASKIHLLRLMLLLFKLYFMYGYILRYNTACMGIDSHFLFEKRNFGCIIIHVCYCIHFHWKQLGGIFVIDELVKLCKPK